MINLEQIKADIAARKAMPAWGPQTSIERIRTINATLPSFSLKTVEALVEMLEKSQRANAAQDDHINQQQDRIDQLENAAAKLGRRLTQYLMGPVVPDDAKLRELFDSWFASDCSFDRSPAASEADNIAWRESYWYIWQCCYTAMLQAGTFRESTNSSTETFREISKTSTKGCNQLLGGEQ